MIEVKLNSNINEVMKKYSSLQHKFPAMMKRFTVNFYDFIGMTATGEYMKAFTISAEQQKTGISTAGRNFTSTLRIVTGRLMRSIRRIYNFNQSGDGVNESYFKFASQGNISFVASIGSQVPYAMIHEKGGTIYHNNLFGRGISATINIPKRPYMKPAAEKSETKVSPIFEQTLKQMLGEFNG